MSNSLWSHGLQHASLPCSSLSPGVCSNSCPLSWWCHPTILSCHPLLLLPSIFPNIRVFFNELALLYQVVKELELQLQHQSFQWIFRVDFLWDWLVWGPCCPRDSQECSPAPLFESANSLVLSLLYGTTLISIHDYFVKTITSTIWSFVAKWCLCFVIHCLGFP